ncbi:MAG: BamA/TamA family outer membrane protein [Nitrospirales bacterium]|nr:BamA/TamA family outer membrane protein [Nitrospirales bacterium]
MGSLLFPWAEVAAEERSYFVIPAVATSKNDGTDVGVIVPYIFADDEGRVTQIVAPMYIHNEFVGSRATINFFRYPARGEQIKLIASITEKTERRFQLDAQKLFLDGGRYSLEGNVGFFKNGTARFFGLGNQTSVNQETNYTDRELLGFITGGLYVGPGRRVTWTERLRNVEIQVGAVPNIPFTQSVFPAIKGTGGATVWGHKLAFLDDTRDDTLTPTVGSYFTMFAELAQSLTADTNTVFSRYGFDYRILLPNATKRYTFVFRAKFDATVGGAEIPFFERSSLGGQTTLRGFGVGRFVDNHALVISAEERIQLFHLKVFGTVAELEMAPFLDVGKVTDTFRYRALSQYEANPGIGFRAIARPNVVARVDVATGNEGRAIFAGLDFPF